MWKGGGIIAPLFAYAVCFFLPGSRFSGTSSFKGEQVMA